MKVVFGHWLFRNEHLWINPILKLSSFFVKTDVLFLYCFPYFLTHRNNFNDDYRHSHSIATANFTIECVKWSKMTKFGQKWNMFDWVFRSERDPKTPVGKEANEELVLDLKIVLKKDEINKHGVVYHNRPWPNKSNEICTLIPFFR